MRLDVGRPHLGEARMGREEPIVEPAHQRRGALDHLVGEHAEHLLGQLVLGHAVVIVDAGLGAPADVQRGVHVGLRPLHDLAEFRPVVHFFEFQPLHRRPGDDKAVEVLVAHRVEGGVEGLQMLGGRVLRVVARRLQQLHFNLQRRVRQLPQNLGLRGDLGGHEVQQQQPQRTNVLVHGAMLGHDEDVLVLQRRRGRQRIGNANGHASSYSTAARAWSMSAMRSAASSMPQDRRMRSALMPAASSSASFIWR